MERSQQKAVMGQSQQEANQCYTRGTEGHLKDVREEDAAVWGLITSSPLGWKKVLKIQCHSSRKALAPGHFWICQACSWFREGTAFCLHTSGPQGKPWGDLAHNMY